MNINLDGSTVTHAEHEQITFYQLINTVRL